MFGAIFAAVVGIVVGSGYLLKKGVDSYNAKIKAERQAKLDYQYGLRDELTSIENELNLNIFNSLSESQLQLSDAQLQLDTINKNITSAQDWLSLYQGMLSGEDNILSAERDQAQDAITNSQNALTQYEESSALAVRNIFEDANDQVQSAQQSIAMANVAASATGSVVGAYKTEALKVRSDLRRFVGSDGFLNEATGEGEIGTFAQELMATRTEINNTIIQLDSQLKAAQLALETWDYDTKNQAETYENDIEGYEALKDSYQIQLDTARENIETYSQTALEKIKDWKETMEAYAGTGAEDALSSEEIKKQIQSWKDKYKNYGSADWDI